MYHDTGVVRLHAVGRASTGPAAQRQPTDRELVRRCQQQDADAWNILVARYERLVHTVALRNGLSPEDAADVTQITFVALVDALPRLRNDERLASWLMTVARRQSWRIRNSARAAISVDVVPEDRQVTTTDPFAEWDSTAALHDGMSTLGGTCRELLLALYFDPAEPSYAEVASRFGRSVGSIGPLRGRCLEKLRDILDDHAKESTA